MRFAISNGIASSMCSKRDDSDCENVQLIFSGAEYISQLISFAMVCSQVSQGAESRADYLKIRSAHLSCQKGFGFIKS